MYVEKNSLYVNLKQYIDGQSGTYFGMLANTNIDALTTLKFNLDQVLHQINAPDTWDDSIAWTINDETSSGIPEMILACEDPALTALGKLDAVLSGLQNPLNQYDILVDDYNDKEAELKRKFPSIPSQTKTTTKTDPVTGEVKTITESNPDYDTYLSLKVELETINDSINLCTPIIDNCIDTLKGLLSEVGSQEFNSANQAGIAFGDIEQGDADPSNYGYDSNYKVKEVVQKDKDGNIVGVSYTVTDENGNVVETGSYKYDNNGKVDEIKRYKKPPEPTPIPDDANVGIYVSDDTIPVEESSETNVTEVDSVDEIPKPIKDSITPATAEKLEDLAEETGGSIVVDETHTEKEFSDGTQFESTTQAVGVQTKEGEGNGVITPPNDTIVLQSEEHGTIETPDGEVYNYDKSATYGEDGLEHSEETITDKNGDPQYQKTEDVDTAFKEDWSNYYATNDDTVEVTKDSVTITTDFSLSRQDGSTYGTKKTVITRKLDENGEPNGESSVTYEDGRRYEYTYNEDGKLVCTEYRTDKNNNEVKCSTSTVTDEKYLFTIKEPDGTTQQYTVNMAVQTDQQFVENQFLGEKMKCGTSAEEIYSGYDALLSGNYTVGGYTLTLEEIDE